MSDQFIFFFLLCWSSHQGCKRPFKIKPNQTQSDWAQFSSRINQILLCGSAISKPIKPQTNGTQSNSDWVWQPSSNEHNLDNNYWLHSILWMICLNKDHVTWSQKQQTGGQNSETKIKSLEVKTRNFLEVTGSIEFDCLVILCEFDFLWLPNSIETDWNSFLLGSVFFVWIEKKNLVCLCRSLVNNLKAWHQKMLPCFPSLPVVPFLVFISSLRWVFVY